MRLILIVLGLVVFVGTATAQSTAQPPNLGDIVFGELEKRLLRDYFCSGKASTDGQQKAEKSKAKNTKGKGKDKGKSKGKGKAGKGGGTPPGLARKDSPPPGLARQLERNGTLPPGLARRDLPADLEAKLPRAEAGRKRVIVDNDVILIEQATGRILDILKDVLK
jgi:hypothetical protein